MVFSVNLPQKTASDVPFAVTTISDKFPKRMKQKKYEWLQYAKNGR